MSRNGFGDEGCAALAKGIEGLAKLRKLDLWQARRPELRARLDLRGSALFVEKYQDQIFDGT